MSKNAYITKQGMSLIEVIVYIALLGILTVGVAGSVHALTVSAHHLFELALDYPR